MNRVLGRQGGLVSIFLSVLVVASMIGAALSAPFFVRADEDVPVDPESVFCVIDDIFEGTGDPVHEIFGTACPDGETPTQCDDGLDNDLDGVIDLEDPGCSDASDNDETDPAPSVFQCNDGLDNDDDGKTDWNAIPGEGDAGCLTPLDDDEGDEPVINPENTALLCADFIDNDEDGQTDLADSDCDAFKPVLVVKKLVSGGFATASDFSFSVNGGATTTFEGDGENLFTYSATSTYAVLETATSTYTASYEGCSGDLTVGATSTCTITNTYVTEEPAAQCADGIDNDDDGLTDMSDPGCSDSSDDDETNSSGGGGGGSPADCADGSDNDNDGLIDMADPGCENSSDDDESTVVPGSSSSTGGGGGGGVISGSLAVGAGGGPIAPAIPTVLGTTTTAIEDCGQYINTFIKFGRPNDPEQVTRLQQFLNEFEGFALAVTGVYDEPTLAAVEAFQLKYASDILAPWGIGSPTGHVYLTTRKKVNELYCKGTNQFPLSGVEEAEIERYREGRGAGQVGGAQTSASESAPQPSPKIEPVEPVEPAEPVLDLKVPEQPEAEAADTGEEEPGFVGRLWRSIIESIF